MLAGRLNSGNDKAISATLLSVLGQQLSRCKRISSSDLVWKLLSATPCIASVAAPQMPVDMVLFGKECRNGRGGDGGGGGSVALQAQPVGFANTSNPLPVSNNDFRLDSTIGQPWRMPVSMPLPGSSSSWVTVSRTMSW